MAKNAGRRKVRRQKRSLRARLRACERKGLYQESQKGACGLAAIISRDSQSRSHETLRLGRKAMMGLEPRGSGCGKTGDGTGVIIDTPVEFLFKDIQLGRNETPAVAMLFLPKDNQQRDMLLDLVRTKLEESGFRWHGYRQVPVRANVLGRRARQTMPEIVQVLFSVPLENIFVRGLRAVGTWFANLYRSVRGEPELLKPNRVQERISLAQKEIERAFLEFAREHNIPDDLPYVVSMSAKTVTYKALSTVRQLFEFYPDLTDEEVKATVFVGHRRYSTNTRSTWANVQPFRFVAHNGEINTLAGVRRWWIGRFMAYVGNLFRPLFRETNSDSGNLDECIGLMTAQGYSLEEALRLLVPPSYKPKPGMGKPMPANVQAYFDYHGTMIEPWDGPAGILATDGNTLVALLDRHGLRPLVVESTRRYHVIASEMGVAGLPDRELVNRFQVNRGEMIRVRLDNGEITRGVDLTTEFAGKTNYTRLANITDVELLEAVVATAPPHEYPLIARQLIYGWRNDEMMRMIIPLALDGKVPKGSMGDDTAFWALRNLPSPFVDSLRQLFSQVTNPSVDAEREIDAFDMDTTIGATGSPFLRQQNSALLRFPTPVLGRAEMELIGKRFSTRSLDATFNPQKQGDLKHRLGDLRSEAVKLVREGVTVLVVDDSNISSTRAPIPVTLVIAGIHRDLLGAGLRFRCSLVARSQEVCSAHGIAAALTYGAEAVHPALVEETLLCAESISELKTVTGPTAWSNWRTGITSCLRLIMGRMGITPLSGFIGAQMLAPWGLNDEIVSDLFPAFRSNLGGLGYDDIEEVYRGFHGSTMQLVASGELPKKLPEFGRFRALGKGESLPHGWSKDYYNVVQQLITASSEERDGLRVRFREITAKEPVKSPKHLLRFRTVPSQRRRDHASMMSTADIKRRFFVAPMSDGALGPWVHEHIALAASVGGFSANCGEGGLDPERYGTTTGNDIRQVASGRFGVTIRYLADENVIELNIKVVQAVKPGQGGAVDGKKVNKRVARIRGCMEGTDLLSPANNVDFHSIEDLAALIVLLRRANPYAAISVKIAASVGVGTVALGVAKALHLAGNPKRREGKTYVRNSVYVQGKGGGTGNTPLDSQQGAAFSTEEGLAEAYQALALSGYHKYIDIIVDGQLRSGRDVVLMAILGASRFGFGTAAVIALGCTMCRVCEKNTCPKGVATTNDVLKAKYTGRPEHLVNFMDEIALEVQDLLWELGVSSLDELQGRTDLLEAIDREDAPKSSRFDLSRILYQVEATEDPELEQTHGSLAESRVDEAIIEAARAVIESGEGTVVVNNVHVTNDDGPVGPRFSYEVERAAQKRGGKFGGKVVVNVHGHAAAQAFGALIARNTEMVVTGAVNSFFGQSMSEDAVLVVKLPSDSALRPGSLIGLHGGGYGAMGGKIFLQGSVANKLAPANHGCKIVAEGCGEYSCQSMSAGTVVVLGEIGGQFGAGMTGGRAFVYCPNGDPSAYLHSSVSAKPLTSDEDAQDLHDLISEHCQRTGSKISGPLLARWQEERGKFYVVRSNKKPSLALPVVEGASPTTAA